MTTDVMTPTTPTEIPARSAGSLLLPIAGGALIAGSLLYVAGMATSPSASAGWQHLRWCAASGAGSPRSWAR